jgi:hypothetical protein
MRITTGRQFEYAQQLMRIQQKMTRELKKVYAKLSLEQKKIHKFSSKLKHYEPDAESDYDAHADCDLFVIDYILLEDGDVFYYVDAQIQVSYELDRYNIYNVVIQTSSNKKDSDVIQTIIELGHKYWIKELDNYDNECLIVRVSKPLIGLKNDKFFDDSYYDDRKKPTILTEYVAKDTYRSVIDCTCSSTSPVSLLDEHLHQQIFNLVR